VICVDKQPAELMISYSVVRYHVFIRTFHNILVRFLYLEHVGLYVYWNVMR
jgi:hypothetical protein